MWPTFLIALCVFLIAVAGMAVGVIISNRRLKGSCGGVSGTTDEQGNPMCQLCTNVDTCEDAIRAAEESKVE